MVLYLETLEGILRDHCALLEIVIVSCKKWEVEPPVSEQVRLVVERNLEVIGELRAAGFTKMETPEKKV